MKNLAAITLIILLFAVSCEPKAQLTPDLPQPAVAHARFTPSPEPTLTPTPSLSPTINPLRTIAPTIVPSPTADPFIEMYLTSLAARKYGGGVLEDLGALNSTSGAFARRLFRYRSEGLALYGFLDIPEGEGPFPVILMLHGYVNPDEYKTLDYSTRYADALAEQGYIVLHPNLRGYAPSPDADNRLGIGDTIDTLNLLALVRQSAGSEGLLKKADASRIGLWGHSMGGGIVMRILTIDPEIKAALLYASINADERLNLAHFEDDGRGVSKTNASDETLALISPRSQLAEVETPLSIHHGEEDRVVPVEWSKELCEYLEASGGNVDCVIYRGQPHTFQNSGDTQFIANSIRFFNETMPK